MPKQVKIVTIGGAGGQANVLEALADEDEYQVIAICTASDSGRDTGRSVKEYGKFGVNGSLGDVGKCLCALSPDKQLALELMHRFSQGCREDQSVKNSLYLGLIQMYGPKQALDRMHEILKIRENHRCLPVTFARTHLRFKLADGTRLSKETVLDSLSQQKLWNLKAHRVKKVWLSPPVSAEAKVVLAIAQADWIIISPGDLYTSIIPVLLVKGVAEAIAKSPAKLMVILNLMTKIGETDGFAAADFIRQIIHHTQNRIPDVVICNSNSIPEDSLKRYRRKEHKVAVVADTFQGTEFSEVKIISANLWAKTQEGYIVHDPAKLRTIFNKIIN